MKQNITQPCFEEDYVLHTIRFLQRHHSLLFMICTENATIKNFIVYTAIYKDYMVRFEIDKEWHRVKIQYSEVVKAGNFVVMCYVKHSYPQIKSKSFRAYYNRPREPTRQARQ